MKFKGVVDIRYISSTLQDPSLDSKTKTGGNREEINVSLLKDSDSHQSTRF